MTADELKQAGIPVEESDELSLLRAESALDWIAENTTLEVDKSNPESIAGLPACAKLFVVKYSEIMAMRQGVSSQSIEGMSLSFNTADQSAQVYQLARSLLGGYMRSQVQVIPAKRRW